LQIASTKNKEMSDHGHSHGDPTAPLDVPVSTSYVNIFIILLALWQLPTTAAYALLVLGLLLGGWYLRARMPRPTR
jgi:hypothetical protein